MRTRSRVVHHFEQGGTNAGWVSAVELPGDPGRVGVDMVTGYVLPGGAQIEKLTMSEGRLWRRNSVVEFWSPGIRAIRSLRAIVPRELADRELISDSMQFEESSGNYGDGSANLFESGIQNMRPSRRTLDKRWFYSTADLVRGLKAVLEEAKVSHGYSDIYYGVNAFTYNVWERRGFYRDGSQPDIAEILLPDSAMLAITMKLDEQVSEISAGFAESAVKAKELFDKLEYGSPLGHDQVSPEYVSLQSFNRLVQYRNAQNTEGLPARRILAKWREAIADKQVRAASGVDPDFLNQALAKAGGEEFMAAVRVLRDTLVTEIGEAERFGTYAKNSVAMLSELSKLEAALAPREDD